MLVLILGIGGFVFQKFCRTQQPNNNDIGYTPLAQELDPLADLATRPTNRFGEGLDANTNQPTQFWTEGYKPDVTPEEVIQSQGALGALSRTATKSLKSVLKHPFRTIVHMYTVEAPLYKILNKAMRENIQTEIELYRDYIYYLSQALEQLPPLKENLPLYRCIDVQLDYKKDETVLWPAFSSSTTDPNVAVSFLRGSAGTLFLIDGSKSAKCISDLSASPGEAEALFPPNSQFKMKGHLQQSAKAILEKTLKVSLAKVNILIFAEL